ncbi:hypothetical protein RRG08_016287 [Elysia crispata]|uniref:Uncharacterized protein n=1 Tax=Elysia crispata TaxID=231223 RepID=A0AAE1B5Y2_9GAST|nr:hypothetical protein RRG08_016287 [Elysia crispata]
MTTESDEELRSPVSVCVSERDVLVVADSSLPGYFRCYSTPDGDRRLLNPVTFNTVTWAGTQARPLVQSRAVTMETRADHPLRILWLTLKVSALDLVLKTSCVRSGSSHGTPSPQLNKLTLT